MRGVWRCVRLFRPHPSLRDKLLAVFLPPRRGRLFWLCVALCGASWQARSRLLAPRQGGGVRLRSAVRLSRSTLHPVCRYDEVICSEMTRWVTGAWDEKQNAVLVRKVKHRIGQENKMPYLSENKTPYPFSLTVLYFTQNKLRITPLSPPCHPERSGTTRKKSRATTNHCRAVEPRPKRGASRRDLRC